MTLEQVAQVFGGMTKERVRQIEDKALIKLRKKIVAYGLGEIKEPRATSDLPEGW